MYDFVITPKLIELAGIDIPDNQLEAFIDHANEQLDERVGEAIAQLLDEEQLTTILELQESGKEEAVITWLSENVSDLEQIVQDEFAILLGDIAEERDAINSPV